MRACRSGHVLRCMRLCRVSPPHAMQRRAGARYDETNPEHKGLLDAAQGVEVGAAA